MINKSKKYFIRTTGKGDMKIYNLINFIDYSQLDIFFNSEVEISKYVKKHKLVIVQYEEN
jgi:hypothetical protein